MIPSGISSEALAYLGDCVIELCVREFLVGCGMTRAGALNAAALDFVRAGAQSEAVKRISADLTEQECAAFRRGRNIGHTSTPKSATPVQYRQATGLEALFGYLHLEGDTRRINELFSMAYADVIEKYNNKEHKEKTNEQPKNQI